MVNTQYAICYTRNDNPVIYVPIRHYICRAISTFVVRALQIRPFMQNKANFPDSQMNVNKVLTKDYENETLSGSGKNKANTNPNKANTNPNKANLLNDQMNVNKVLTKDYENKLNWAIFENKPNSNPIQTQTKPISDYPCVFELAVYNLVLRYGNLMYSIPNGRNFNGEYIKWQMRLKQMR